MLSVEPLEPAWMRALNRVLFGMCIGINSTNGDMDSFVTWMSGIFTTSLPEPPTPMSTDMSSTEPAMKDRSSQRVSKSVAEVSCTQEPLVTLLPVVAVVPLLVLVVVPQSTQRFGGWMPCCPSAKSCILNLRVGVPELLACMRALICVPFGIEIGRNTLTMLCVSPPAPHVPNGMLGTLTVGPEPTPTSTRYATLMSTCIVQRIHATSNGADATRVVHEPFVLAPEAEPRFVPNEELAVSSSAARVRRRIGWSMGFLRGILSEYLDAYLAGVASALTADAPRVHDLFSAERRVLSGLRAVLAREVGSELVPRGVDVPSAPPRGRLAPLLRVTRVFEVPARRVVGIADDHEEEREGRERHRHGSVAPGPNGAAGRGSHGSQTPVLHAPSTW